MKPGTMMERIRQRLCLHRNAYIRAATGLERAGGQHEGNGSVGVTLTCLDCGWQVSTDVVMAVPRAALDALYLPCHCTHEAGDSPCPLHGMDEETAPQRGSDARCLECGNHRNGECHARKGHPAPLPADKGARCGLFGRSSGPAPTQPPPPSTTEEGGRE